MTIPGHEPKIAKVIARHTYNDLCLLKIEELPEDPYTFSPLSTLEPFYSELLYTIGNIGYKKGKWITTGEVIHPLISAQECTPQWGKQNDNPIGEIFQRAAHDYYKRFSGMTMVTSRYRRGQSGSPAFNQEHQIKGIVSVATTMHVRRNISEAMLSRYDSFTLMKRLLGLTSEYLPIKRVSFLEPAIRTFSMLERIGVNVNDILEGKPSKIK